MSTQESKSPTTTDGKKKPREFSWRLVALAALTLYAIPFVLLNTDEIKINFVFFSTRISLIFALLIMGISGFAAGVFLSQLRARRKRG